MHRILLCNHHYIWESSDYTTPFRSYASEHYPTNSWCRAWLSWGSGRMAQEPW
jgi:hypothetical protein